MKRKVSTMRRSGPVAAAAAAASSSSSSSSNQFAPPPSTQQPTHIDMGGRAHYYQPLTGTPLYKLKSSDGQIFEVERAATKQSALITTYWIENGITDRNCAEAAPMEVPYHSSIVAMILEWLQHHKDDRTSRTRKRRVPYDDFSVWDKRFLDIESGVLFALLNASYHLGIEPLMNMGCAAAAELIRGKTTEEIRVIYGIRSDEEAAAAGEPGPSGLNHSDDD